jgi:AraC family transcriptional regulator
MTAALPQLNRFLVCSDYSVYFRRVKRFQWESPATASYAILIVSKGELSYNSRDKRGVLDRSQSLILEPNVGVTVEGNQVEFIFLALSASMVIDRALSMRLIAPETTVTFSHTPIEDDRKLSELVTTMTSELLSDKPGKEIVIGALVEQVLVQILRHHSKIRRSDELELSRVGLIDRRIRRSIELMYSQLDQDLPLRELAAASYLSPFHFARLFKKLTGSTPHNYLAAIRATRAQLLLAESDLSISEVGARVGYLSSSHFTRAFRVATGTTPREFRNALVGR